MDANSVKKQYYATICGKHDYFLKEIIENKKVKF